MGHAHHCGHSHHHKLDAALILTLLFAIVELIGGWMSNSLALLADAAHMTSDVVALALAALAGRLARKPAHLGMTYGYGRARVLAAQLNGFALWFLSGWIAWEAVGRLSSVPDVQGGLVIGVALLGLLVNLIILKWLHGDHDINTRAAYWHVVGDAIGSVAAIVAGAVIYLTGWMLIDPILSFLVAGILAWGGWRLVRETTSELMAAVPADIDIKHIIAVLKETAGVVDVHHAHLWTLPDSRKAISAHIDVEAMADWDSTLKLLLQTLHKQGIDHATLQPESAHMQKNCAPCTGHSF